MIVILSDMDPDTKLSPQVWYNFVTPTVIQIAALFYRSPLKRRKSVKDWQKKVSFSQDTYSPRRFKQIVFFSLYIC